MFTDYLGNEIKEGMIIKIMRTKPMYNIEQSGYFYKGEFHKVGEPINPPEKIWECVDEWPVIMGNDGRLKYVDNWGSDEKMNFDMNCLEFGRQPNDLITIKGISDHNPNDLKVD